MRIKLLLVRLIPLCYPFFVVVVAAFFFALFPCTRSFHCVQFVLLLLPMLPDETLHTHTHTHVWDAFARWFHHFFHMRRHFFLVEAYFFFEFMSKENRIVNTFMYKCGALHARSTLKWKWGNRGGAQKRIFEKKTSNDGKLRRIKEKKTWRWLNLSSIQLYSA